MIVADTNLIAYLLIAGPRTPSSQAVLRKDQDWSAPLLWRSEFRNVLALYLRQNHLTLADALEFIRQAEGLMEGQEYAVDSAAVLRLAEASGLSAYDCEFVYLAQELGVPLVSSDARLLRTYPKVAVSPEGFAP